MLSLQSFRQYKEPQWSVAAAEAEETSPHQARKAQEDTVVA
jgi:hypothetical protein